MKTERRDEPAGVRILIQEDLDMHVAGELQTELHGALQDKPQSLIVDLAGVGFIDSAGIAVIIESLKRARLASIAFRVENPSPQVKDTFEIAGLTKILGIA
jgi:anti-sigma B factor antagonist